MNVAIFEATAIITKQSVKTLRIVISSVLGAAYACVLFGADIVFAGLLPIKIIFGFIITAIAFKPKTMRAFIKKTLVFHGVTLAYGFLITGLLYFTDLGLMFGGAVKNGIFYFDIPLWFIIPASIMAPISAALVSRITSHSPVKECHVITLEHRGLKTHITALADTGNFLKDPYNGNDVIIVEKEAILPLFPSECLCTENFSSLPGGFRLIPYSSLGNSTGFIAGFVPDKIAIEKTTVTRVTIAVYDGILSQSGDYSAVSKPITIFAKGHNLCSEKSLLS